MEWVTLGLILLLGLLFLLALGMPIAFSLGVLSTGAILILGKPELLTLVGQTAYTTPGSFVLVAVPLFILLAEVLAAAEMTNDLFEAASSWFGRIPGSLASGSVVGCAIFAALTGSSSANTAALGSVCTPEMLRRGYDKGLATGSVTAAGALGILIPPSILMIFYGSLTEQSVGELFIAGVIPGIMLAALFVIYITLRCLYNPKLAPASDRRLSWREKWRSTMKIWWALLIVGLMMGGIYSGVCTATEAAGIGAFVAMLLGLFVAKKLTMKKLKLAVLRTVWVTCMVLFIMVGAMIFGYFTTHLGIPQAIVNWVAQLQVSRWTIMVALNVVFLFLGCILDAASIVMITIPIIYPIITKLGFDPIWFGVVVTVNMEIGMITPPMGLNLFVMKGIVPPEVSFQDIVRGTLPFMVVQLIALALTIAFPELCLWLPRTMR